MANMKAEKCEQVVQARKSFLVEYDALFSKAEEAVRFCGFRIKRSDRAGGVIEAKVSMTLNSWGEIFTVNVSRDGSVTARSEYIENVEGATTFVAKTRKDVDSFFEHLGILVPAAHFNALEWSKKYPPRALELAHLAPEETQISSFYLSQMKKNWPLGYGSTRAVNFHCHITDQRLIFEFITIPKWLTLGMKAALFFIDAPPSAEVAAKVQLWETSEAHRAFSGRSFDIGYRHIKQFQAFKNLTYDVAKIVLNDPPRELRDDGLVFMVNTVGSENTILAWSTASKYARDFVQLGNSVLYNSAPA
jgi:hypothetical protein